MRGLARAGARLTASLYRGLLRLYPSQFRARFEAEMTDALERASREALLGERPWPVLLSLWLMVAGDLLWTLPVQWMRTGLPLVATLAAAATTSVVSALAWLLSSDRPLLHVAPADRDLAALLLLVAVVLLIVAATIVLSLWFLRPLVYRRRL